MNKNNQVITLGCRLNYWESEKINNILKKQNKNCVVFNTCSVTNEAIKSARKKIKLFHKRNPKIKIAVTGCGVESNYAIFNNMKEVSIIVNNKDKLEENSWKKVENLSNSVNFSKFDLDILNKENPSNSQIRKFVRIQNGCDHSCTFCIIPSCRGKSKSDSIEKISEEITKNLSQGVKEIILTGVDITSWNDEKNINLKLGDLLEKIFLKNKYNFRLRLSSIDAAEIDDKLLFLIKNEARLMPHFHFSLQSLDDMILKRMKRRHNVSQIIKLFEKIRNVCSNVTFGADFITGFPTENEKMFLNTFKLIEQLQISHLHVFPYSQKEGTPACKMPQVEMHVRRKRAKLIRDLGKSIYRKILNEQKNVMHNILIETGDGTGKTANNFKVKSKLFKKGSLVKAIPTSISEDYLIVN